MAVSKIPKSLLTKLLPCVTSNLCMSTSHSPKINFSGVFTPVATPFNEDESISFDKLSQNFSKWNSTKLKGYLVEGSSGEAVLLDEEERIQLVKKVRSLVPQGKLLLAGGGCEGTRNTVRTCQKMAEAGADAVMVVTPCYYKTALNDRSLICHYEAVADSSPVPVLLYSVPANTGVDLSVEAVRVLCQHPNIVGMKDSTGDITKLAALVAATKKEDFQMLAGSAGYFLASLHVGCIGAVCGLGNILPEPLCELYEQFQAGQLSKNGPGDDILVLQQRLLAPNTAVTKSYGVAGLKLAMDLMGYFGGPLRKPLMPLLPEQAKLLKDAFVQSNFLSSS